MASFIDEKDKEEPMKEIKEKNEGVGFIGYFVLAMTLWVFLFFCSSAFFVAGKIFGGR